MVWTSERLTALYLADAKRYQQNLITLEKLNETVNFINSKNQN